MNKYKKITLDGLIFQNPTFMLVLGTCPTLAMIKQSATSAMGMGLTVLVILVFLVGLNGDRFWAADARF